MIADGIIKTFRTASGEEAVLRGVSFALTPTDHLAVLGASGSGKTTLLRILAGLERADAGRISLGDDDISDWPPERRRVVYMPQDALLFPHLSALENVLFPLRVQGVSDADARERARPLMTRLGLDAHAGKRPDALSGGQRQRVAFGRAILASPRVLLLDEPFSALDHAARSEMQSVFLDVVVEQSLATLFVTHDPGEALRIGSRWGHLAAGALHLFHDREAFVTADRTGIPQERSFWASI